MSYRLLNVAIATFLLGAAPARASDLPSFEQSGFPVTPHQVALLGAENVQEQTPAPMLPIAGMPASPLQIAVLDPGTERFKPSPAGHGALPDRSTCSTNSDLRVLARRACDRSAGLPIADRRDVSFRLAELSLR
ncbi:hypothetical protein ABIE89_007194 [Bradyrhizobium niftali]|uniref:hypothetical protein n=1 Tax=Bradyrhizobium niftali TaxID=2560055 RepID=UPI00383285F2